MTARYPASPNSVTSSSESCERASPPVLRAWWWLALAILVANDHWLKSAELLPGWFTGKLSDFAGLMVAAPLLAHLAVWRGRATRFVCWAAVGGVFAAINVSHAAAEWMEVATASIGFPWQIWTDPTDLVALLALPLAWHLSYGCRQAPRDATGDRRLWSARGKTVQTAAVVVGSIACLATSPARDYATGAYFVNSTATAREVRIFEVGALPACPQDEPAWDATEQPRLRFRGCGTLVYEDWVTLDIQQRLPDGPDEGSRPISDCDAVVIATPGLRPTVVIWNRVDWIRFSERDVEELDPYAIYLESAGEDLFLAQTEKISTRQVDWSLPETDCETAERFAVTHGSGASD